ncbi:MAG: hypothetical protein M1821_005877 [Bathelium mastoideum]|nr:MAG: hypothetical protein M1821_005877 [Bathelium mastoideum]
MTEAAQPQVPSLEPLARREDISLWYRSNLSASDIAKEAYDDAVTYFNSELTKDERKRIRLGDYNSIDEIYGVVHDLRKHYQGSNDNKQRVQKWVEGFSSQVLHYAAVLDTLAQHHPEYVSLAWGTIKFVFVGIIDHGELVVQFSRALTDIGRNLPAQKFYIAIFPTTQIKEATSRLYAHLMKFLKQAVAWYQRRLARRVLYAMRKPYELNLKDTVEDIRECSKFIDRLAAAANMAELRDVHINIEDLQTRLGSLGERYNGLDSKVDNILQLLMAKDAINQSLRFDIEASRSQARELQNSRIADLLEDTPISESGLRLSLSLAKRRQSWRIVDRDALGIIRNMARWMSTPQASLHVITAGLRAGNRAKDLAAMIVNLLRAASSRVIWSLSSDAGVKDAVSIIRSLFFQACRQDPAIYSHAYSPLSIINFENEHTAKEWIRFLALALRTYREEQFFLILETDIEDIDLTVLFQRLAASLTNTKVKILLVLSSTSRLELPPTADCAPIMSSIQQGTPAVAAKRFSRPVKPGKPADLLREIFGDG